MPLTDLHINNSIYCWKITETEKELINLTYLSSFENKRIFSIKRIQRRKEMLATRVLLNTIIPNEHIHYKNKNPFLVNSNKEISISNSGNLVVIQLKEKNELAGVDIQFIADTVLRVKHKFLHPSEYNLLTNNDLLILNIIWSAKESLYKAHSIEKLNFKSQLIIKNINLINNKITGVVVRSNKKEKFTLGLFVNKEFVLTWFS